MSDNKFLPGVFFERPKPGRPEFVKGRMSIQVDKFVEFLQANKTESGYINADLLQSKDGSKLYFSHDDYKPEKKEDDSIPPEAIPF